MFVIVFVWNLHKCKCWLIIELIYLLFKINLISSSQLYLDISFRIFVKNLCTFLMYSGLICAPSSLVFFLLL